MMRQLQCVACWILLSWLVVSLIDFITSLAHVRNCADLCVQMHVHGRKKG